MKYKIILLFTVLVLVNTTGHSQQKNKKYTIVIKHHLCDNFKQFWGKFQKDIINNDTDAIIKYFKFPMFARCFNDFNSSAYCDTGKYKWKKFRDTLIVTKNNFKLYYTITFSDFIKNMIKYLSSDKIELYYNDSKPRAKDDEKDDTVCNGVTVWLNLQDSKEYKHCLNKMGQLYEATLSLHFEFIEGQYRLIWIQCI